ncbi:hypothetical protein DFH06DRAFT_1347196 [Mycena polygramma]|nr:hypothetical protein DFH06DRAFT_1347196 [Mycena polygramma]
MSSDVPQMWKVDLEPGITAFLRGETSAAPYALLMAMHTTVFAICSITPKSASARELHAQATSFLSGYTAQIQAAAPDDDAAVPYYYDTQWDTFARGAYSIDPAFISMNKLFVQCQLDMKTIRNVALEQWKINVLEALAPRLERALGADAPRIAAIRTKLASENATVEDFNSMRFHEVYAGSA